MSLSSKYLPKYVVDLGESFLMYIKELLRQECETDILSDFQEQFSLVSLLFDLFSLKYELYKLEFEVPLHFLENNIF